MPHTFTYTNAQHQSNSWNKNLNKNLNNHDSFPIA